MEDGNAVDVEAGQVIDFWRAVGRKRWFVPDENLDNELLRRFSGIHDRISRSDPEQLLASPKRALAALIVLDQFSRNMFRGTPAMFASDVFARFIAAAAVDQRFDQEYETDMRAFFYLPFEHSEALADQHRSVALFEKLGDEEYLRFAEAHRQIIQKFGRFPHRNAILGREVTPEEDEFLKTQGSSF